MLNTICKPAATFGLRENHATCIHRQHQQQAYFEDVTCTGCRAQSQNLKELSTTSHSTNSCLHARDPKVLSPGHPKCRTMVMKRTPAGALNSLVLRTGDVERNPGTTQLCHASRGVITTKVMECVKCGARCHMMCSSLTRSEALDVT